ncbi:alpha/beta fold hydrolase [Actinoplanes sp. URMC 104]|uniref:alpha/beta fold hydrolase n=1 Tax=Actinoplanes sp. URMC 104 TaxID=3423409 RepID=UPI003F1AF5C7
MDPVPFADRGTHLLVQGIRTRVEVRGEGPPLLLLNGIWGELAAWRRVLPYVPGFRTITFDAPGIGGTEIPPYPMSLPALARFAVAVLDAVGERRAHVLGVSFGGIVAQQVATQAPQRVDRLVLVSTSCGMLHLPGQPEALLRLMHPLPTDRTGAAAGRTFGGRVRRDPSVLARLNLDAPRSIEAYLHRLTGLTGWWGMPWSIRRPTLVLTGDDDPIVPAGNSRILASLVAGARLVVVPGGGHLMLFDSPGVVGPVIADFLAGAAAGRESGGWTATLAS